MERFVKTGIVPKEKAFVVVQTRDGQTFYFGGFINTPLFGDGKNMWVSSLVAGAAQKLGQIPSLDPEELAKRAASTVGTPTFGVPSVPGKYRLRLHPLHLLKAEWTAMRSLLVADNIDPRFWGWVCALTAQYLILESAARFDQGVAVRIAMEAAVPMSKIDEHLL